MDVEQARAIDAAAEFLPSNEGGYPAIKLGGVWVIVYADPVTGGMVISADFDQSEFMDPTPVIVKMSGEMVWSTPNVQRVVLGLPALGTEPS